MEPELLHNSSPPDFIAGVVEGFYGRPWTSEHRRELFRRMRRMGLSTYVYAPKDDLKHRAYWREPYTPDEAEHLEALISAARAESVDFVYALSPGIDIVYSSPKEIRLIKQKLQQVSDLGCASFALLFDDIEPVMSDVDKGKFHSFAEAQVAVTNEIHEALKDPPKLFLFCPTEYCESRAVPSLANSAYLNYIGKKLLPPIQVLWTGPRVISRVISAAHAKAVARVLRRRPLIWDNLHANDYDSRRVFFGPYSGRPMELKEWISGVVTNPNCEFEANFVALDSLAQWSKATADAAVPPQGATGATQEAGGVAGVASAVVAGAAPVQLYHPDEALGRSLTDWLPEFFVSRNATGAALAATPASELVLGINTCASVTGTTLSEGVGTGPMPAYTPAAIASAVVNPFAAPPLVAEAELAAVTTAPSDPVLTPAMQALNSLSDAYGEPMEMEPKGEGGLEDVETSATTSPVTTTLSNTFPAASATTVTDSCEEGSTAPPAAVEMEDEGFAEEAKGRMGLDDLRLLTELFYLPFQHGIQGAGILREYFWLRQNAHIVRWARVQGDEKLMGEWELRASSLNQSINRIRRLFLRLSQAPNRSLVSDLYPYVWEMERVAGLVGTVAEWIGAGHLSASAAATEEGGDDARPPEISEAGAQLANEGEPWVLRGGLIGELMQSFPMENSVELVSVRPPVPVPGELFRVRPYGPHFKDRLVGLCRGSLEAIDPSSWAHAHPHLACHGFIGAFLELSPEYCFVVERIDRDPCADNKDDFELVGAVFGVVDVESVRGAFRDAQAQLLAAEAPKDGPDKEAVDRWVSETSAWLSGAPEGRGGFSSFLRLLVPQSLAGPLRLLLAAATATMKLNGSAGVFMEKFGLDGELMSRLGFYELPDAADSDGGKFLGRYI